MSLTDPAKQIELLEERLKFYRDPGLAPFYTSLIRELEMNLPELRRLTVKEVAR